MTTYDGDGPIPTTATVGFTFEEPTVDGGMEITYHGRVGRPLNNYEFRATRYPDGEVGEIQVHGASPHNENELVEAVLRALEDI